jgi:DNA polymerase (family X)
MTKHQVAQVLKETAFFLFLKGDNPFKAQAYERAAAAVLAAPSDLPDLIATIAHRPVRHRSRDGRRHHRIGHHRPLDHARGGARLVSLFARGSGRGPWLSRKQILKLHDLAGITSVGDLKAACREGRLLSVPGIGPKLQAKLLDALGEYERGQGYHLYADVVEEAQELEAALKKRIGSRSVTLSGAMRRKMDVVNEFVFVVAVDGKMRMEGIA